MDWSPSCTRSTTEGHENLPQMLFYPAEGRINWSHGNHQMGTQNSSEKSRIPNPTPCRPHLNQMADRHKTRQTRSLNQLEPWQSWDWHNDILPTRSCIPNDSLCQLCLSSILFHWLPNDSWTKGCPQQDLEALIGVVLMSLGITWWQLCLSILSLHVTQCITLRTWFCHQALGMMHLARGG